MCREIHISDIRMALLDLEEDDVVERTYVDEFVAELEDPFMHASEHARRAKRLSSRGDEAAADIHQALLANMVRAAAFN